MRVPVLAMVLVVLTGCGIMPYRKTDLSARAVVIDTPQTQQDEMYDCGLAAISALCGYYGVEIPSDQRTELARLASSHEGLSGNELRDALQRCGLEVYLFEGRLEGGPTSLQSNILARRPMLVLIDFAGNHHYELVIGLDPDSHDLVLLDPALGRVVMPAADFEQRWALTRHFTMLAVPARPSVAGSDGH